MRITVLFIILLLAVLMDFCFDRIPNGLIAAGVILSVWYQGRAYGMHGIIQAVLGMTAPVILLFLLFRIGTLGAGDVKLLAVAGAFLGLRDSLLCMAASFVIGAALSLVKMCLHGNYVTRMQYLAGYVLTTIRSGNIRRYKHTGEPGSSIRFSLPVLLGVLLIYMGRAGDVFGL